VARACLRGGASRLCVIDITEARALRRAGIAAPILLLCATPLEALAEAVSLKVIPTIEDEKAARRLSQLASSGGVTSEAHVAVDTGTGWSGVPAAAAGALAQRLAGLPGVRWEGAWTHVASRESLAGQMRCFDAAVAAMRPAGLELPLVHAASTGPAIWGTGGGPVRVGIGLYGSTLNSHAAPLQLRTALRVTAPVAYVKTFLKETPLGYGGKYVARAGQTIATLQIGYAAGLPKSLANSGSVRLHGRACNIVGDIGMNFTMVALPQESAAAAGDVATIIDEQDGVRLDDVAGSAGMIPHALLTSLASGLLRQAPAGEVEQP
jgi:alanine racemase